MKRCTINKPDRKRPGPKSVYTGMGKTQTLRTGQQELTCTARRASWQALNQIINGMPPCL